MSSKHFSRRPSSFLSCSNNSKCINSPRIFSSHLIFKISVLISSVNASVTMCSWTYVRKLFVCGVASPCVPVALRNKMVVSSGSVNNASSLHFFWNVYEYRLNRSLLCPVTYCSGTMTLQENRNICLLGASIENQSFAKLAKDMSFTNLYRFFILKRERGFFPRQVFFYIINIGIVYITFGQKGNDDSMPNFFRKELGCIDKKINTIHSIFLFFIQRKEMIDVHFPLV